MTQAADDYIGRPITIADLTAKIDGQPRMLDLALAEALGFSLPRMIRRLIDRHKPNLARFGEMLSVGVKSDTGGRPGKAYYLNKKQALYICTKSETENATEVTIQMVEVFDAFTSGKTIKVQEHERRPSTRMDKALSLARSADRLEVVADKLAPIAPPNLCAMIIDGEPVVVDVNQYRLQGERAVVLTWTGELAIMPIESGLPGHKFAGARSAHGPRVANDVGTVRQGVIVVGKVVERKQNDGKQIEMEPHYRGRKTLYRDEILRMIAAGISNREIAQRTGACYQTVTHWRRWREDRMLIAG